ncbi:MAG TPA: PASTA domain-containing protein [Sedimenticola sp.]|nr:PASTA domain-containing protein [Sedimenticola sp.]
MPPFNPPSRNTRPRRSRFLPALFILAFGLTGCSHLTGQAPWPGGKDCGPGKPPHDPCMAALPVRIQASDLDPSNRLEYRLEGDLQGLAVADEVLLEFTPDATEEKIRTLAEDLDGALVGAIPALGIYQIRLSTPLKSPEALGTLLKKLRQDPLVTRAQPNGIGSGSAVTPLIPGDPEYGRQQAVLELIRAPEAWNISKGGGVTIAIVDTGIDLDHPDLAGKVSAGWDYVGNDNDPDDEHGHGTHVAGIAAALTDNLAGVAGVGWNSRLLAIRALNHNNIGTNSAVSDAIREAADTPGVSVINVSYGNIMKYPLCQAVDYAMASGKLVVAAAMNNNTNTRYYPAGCQVREADPGQDQADAVAVGNTTLADVRYTGPAGASNYGAWLDLAAPGVDIYSTAMGGGYTTMTGTSMSTPMVAGAAALLASAEPTLSPAELKQRLMDAAKPLPGEQLGAGRIDLFKTLCPPAVDVPVPDVVNRPQDDAVARVRAACLDAAVRGFETSPAVPAGRVARQNPAAGSLQTPETLVSLFISTGPLAPLLGFAGTEDYEANGRLWTRYRIPVTNWADFPPELFQAAPDLPPCGLNDNASRTWVDIYNGATGARIYGFCALGAPSDLQRLWFAVERGGAPPAGVYIELHDRRTGSRYRSNRVSFP